MPMKTLALPWPVTMDQIKGSWRLWCLWAMLRGAARGRVWGEVGPGSGAGGGGEVVLVHPECSLARSLPNGVSQRPRPTQVMQAKHHHCTAGS